MTALAREIDMPIESSYVASVVIPVHNGGKTLGSQLEALAEQQGAGPFEVIVVLNRCGDNSAQVARLFEQRLRLTVVEADDKPSAAYARNVGAAVGTAHAILFCDADDQVGPTWVREMTHALVHADFVGGKIIVDRAGLADWMYHRFYEPMDNACLVVHDQRIRYPISASLGCRREAFDSVGGFDESFPGAACEETDLAIRMLRTGLVVGEAPDAGLLYRPRTTFRPLMRQVRGYAEGAARLAIREGLSLPVPEPLPELRRTLRALAHLMVREHQWRPGALAGEFLVRYYKFSAERRGSRNDNEVKYGEDSGAVDFVVPITTFLLGGRALLARPSTVQWYASGGGIEQATLGIMCSLLRGGDAVVDVGANIGSFSVTAALCVGNTGSVVAFEPDARTHGVLRANLERHGVASWTQIQPVVVGVRCGTATIMQFDNDLVTGQGIAPASFSPGATVGAVNVDIVTLDAAITTPVDLIKIDVEGFEIDVLAGAAELLRRSPHAILIVELNPACQHAAHHKPEKLISLLAGGERVAWLVEEAPPSDGPRVRRLDQVVVADVAAQNDQWYANVISGPVEREHEIEAAIEATLRQAEPA